VSEVLDLAGIGAGPFNLAVAALLEKAPPVRAAFFERRASFAWHPGQLLPGTRLQTSYLKDLVTPVDPTNRHSFLAYLVAKGRFYAFLNADQPRVTRAEFADYLGWAAGRLPTVRLGQPVEAVRLEGDDLVLEGPTLAVRTRRVVIAVGQRASIPAWARHLIGPRCYHSSDFLARVSDLRGRRVAIVGGGQSGAELFLAIAKGGYGSPISLAWLSRRASLLPLDETHFSNEWFTPAYVERFCRLTREGREAALRDQRLASDGISPATLGEIYQLLYEHRFAEPDASRLAIYPGRDVVGMADLGRGYALDCRNGLDGGCESVGADLVVLATGFESSLPECLEPLRPKLSLDAAGRPELDAHFRLAWDGPHASRLYLQNAGRHSHGIAEPQLSLMAWRAAVIINDALEASLFSLDEGPSALTWVRETNAKRFAA
jgi:lysine N6-hydroxylase